MADRCGEEQTGVLVEEEEVKRMMKGKEERECDNAM